MINLRRLTVLFFGLILWGPLQAQLSVGTAGQVKWSYWRGLPDDDFNELFAHETFPERPDDSRTLYSLKAPTNFDNFYGSLIRGFIKIDQTETIQFNITGDDATRFYLSTDNTKGNLTEIASINGHTGTTEHTKYPEQTSEFIMLNAGQYYYFELLHVEGNGGDHAAVWWKTSFTGLTNWNTVNTDYLFDVIDNNNQDCPVRGTICDDANPNTIDDIQDGYCHCVGSPITTNPCIGSKGKIEWYQYLNIPGGSLNDLLTNENYPGVPQTSSTIDFLGIYNQSRIDSLGSLIEGFITVPVSGQYEFNITGNSRARFFLSSDEQPENKSAHQILNINSLSATNHDNDLSQNMKVNLEAGKYYYFELTHKESTGSEHFGIFWKTPYSKTDYWKRIPAFYIYGFNCELACINNGTNCDDGNPYTNNDQYINCECVGTPCESSDCDSPLANYAYYPECDITDQLDNRSDASWLSCTLSPSPNSIRPDGHWIKYDFGTIYQLHQTQVWNYNAIGEIEKGFNQVQIDYSIDGINWTPLGETYTWELAGGSSDYSGFQGPNFNGIGARYILITSVDPNNQSGCRGIGKILFNANECPSEGTSCNDADAFTAGDIIIDCNCQGVLAITNECETDTLNLGVTSLGTDNYSAKENVISSNTVNPNNLVSFVSGNSIELNYDFQVIEGADFVAQILDCGALENQREIDKILKSKEGLYLEIIPNETGEDVAIDYLVPYRDFTFLKIYNSEGKLIRTLFSEDLLNPGFYRKLIKTKRLQSDSYTIVLKTNRDIVKKVLDI